MRTTWTLVARRHDGARICSAPHVRTPPRSDTACSRRAAAVAASSASIGRPRPGTPDVAARSGAATRDGALSAGTSAGPLIACSAALPSKRPTRCAVQTLTVRPCTDQSARRYRLALGAAGGLFGSPGPRRYSRSERQRTGSDRRSGGRAARNEVRAGAGQRRLAESCPPPLGAHLPDRNTLRAGVGEPPTRRLALVERRLGLSRWQRQGTLALTRQLTSQASRRRLDAF
jgi:hypothetical protein